MDLTTKQDAGLVKYILIVDDDSYTRFALSAALKKCGYKVTSARDSSEALSIISSNQDAIDTAIVDISIPMSGMRFIDEIRKNNPGMQLFIVSGFTDKLSVIELLNRGAPIS
jgi:DNA-binding response OmpR family regulator